MLNYYEILGVPRQATTEEIKSAYRKLAMRYHPDKNPGSPDAESRFKEINEAYRTLAHPNKRTRYDLMIDYALYALYEKSREQSPAQDYRYDPYNRRRGRYDPHIFRQHIDRLRYARLDRIGNFWAFGFLIFTILATAISTTVNSYLERTRYQEMIEENMNLFRNAQHDYNQGDYQAALLKLKNVSVYLSEEADVFRFKERVFNKVMGMAESYYRNENYHKALKHYELIRDNYNFVNLSFYYRMAQCYEETGDHEQAISTLGKLADQGYNKIANYVQIADIYKTSLGEYEQARSYYEKATYLIVKQYAAVYGEAYPLLVNPAATPEIHYKAYMGLADVYVRLEMYGKAIDIYSWALHIRPNLAETYLKRGDCAFLMGDEDLACDSWMAATEKGSTEAFAKLQDYCK